MSKESAPQPDGVSYGANASDNIAITGGVVGDVVLGGKHIYEAPSQVINALHQLPASPRDFTGREAEIVELMSALEDGGFTLFGLRGMGGVGKTALALKLAERLKNRYPQALSRSCPPKL
jgi:hypothetical protein